MCVIFLVHETDSPWCSKYIVFVFLSCHWKEKHIFIVWFCIRLQLALLKFQMHDPLLQCEIKV
jgi:hypothetical protein